MTKTVYSKKMISTNHTLSSTLVQQLIKDCIAGERSQQEHLYKYFAPRMFGICLRYAKDYPQAEDILQEGFIKVFNNLNRFRAEGSFEGWMKRIFINTAIEYYRKSSQRIVIYESDSLPELALDSQIISKLAMDELLQLIQQLPFGYRTVFNLFVIEGYSHKEIAAMLNISEGTSKSQLARARNNLQQSINALT